MADKFYYTIELSATVYVTASDDDGAISAAMEHLDEVEATIIDVEEIDLPLEE